jgi:hypothetical protein
MAAINTSAVLVAVTLIFLKIKPAHHDWQVGPDRLKKWRRYI